MLRAQRSGANHRCANRQVERTVNNYEKISFNFGPTLLSWLERHHPETYGKILEADLVSRKTRGGHGNAIAQAYGHAILPLATDHDRLTQVVWGVADFRHRFGREPESLWLPETACDNRTLDLLIEQNLRFVILAPNQAARVRAAGSAMDICRRTEASTPRRLIVTFIGTGPGGQSRFSFTMVRQRAQSLLRKRWFPAKPWLEFSSGPQRAGHW